ncbi:MAG: PH domain-containing protein [Planctomycetota bacterium]
MTDPPANDADAASAEAAMQSNATQPVEAPAQAAPEKAGSPKQIFEDQVKQRRDGQTNESLDDHDPEESLWQGSYSPKAMIGSWILLSVVSIGILLSPLIVDGIPFLIAFAVVLILWFLIGCNYAARRLGYHYELTSQRFIHKSGLLTRRTDRIEVIDIDDVSYEQGPIQRIFGVGTINITSSDRSDPELCLLGIGKVSEVAGLIDDVRRTERRRRSLHIESI